MSIARIIGGTMDYKQFEDIFNENIFQKYKIDLIKKIADHPERYVGLFRPTKPKAKIIQSLLQSHEIRFGNAFEILIEKYLEEKNFKIQNKRFKKDKKNLKVDHVFTKDDEVFFIEQKIRDDHDSSKKDGQITNFRDKIDVILKDYKEKKVVGFFYFIDDSFAKNKNFYSPEIKKLSKDYDIELHLSYGEDLFEKLHKPEIWDEIIEHLTR